jgi:hypothetical protein
MHHPAVRVSHALQALAPFHAPEIARLLPFPHQQFFALSTARVHLLGLSLIGVDILDIDIALLAAKRWSDVIKPLFDPPPIGLEGVLSKMALPMWSGDDYRRLWDLIGCPHALDHLLHANELTPDLIAILHELPPILRHESIVRHLHRTSEARVIAYAFEDKKKATRLLGAAKPIKKRERFFRKALSIVSKTRKFSTAPEVKHPRIQPIRTPDELRRTALRFKNCLRSHADKASSGERVFYVYEGDEPTVIMLSAGYVGEYVIEQMLGINNAVLSVATQKVIRGAFGRVGVGDRREQARRKAIDMCFVGLGFASADVCRDIDDCCDTLFERLKATDAPGEIFWPSWI